MIKIDAIYEYCFGGTVFVEEIENDKVVYQHMGSGEVETLHIDEFNKYFTYVAE
jgi:hypothetical protein